jgi:hypothetical protein
MDANYFRTMAAKARRLIKSVGDKQTQAALLKVAEEYDAKADAGPRAPPPSEPQGKQPSQTQIQSNKKAE